MYHKVRNSLVAATVAMTMIAAGYGVGSPPADYGTSPFTQIASEAMPATAAEALARKRVLGVQRHMAMPFFSFAPLLPKQGG
jgi:hypothetical protein